jgi:hypothetical protein
MASADSFRHARSEFEASVFLSASLRQRKEGSGTFAQVVWPHPIWAFVPTARAGPASLSTGKSVSLSQIRPLWRASGHKHRRSSAGIESEETEAQLEQREVIYLMKEYKSTQAMNSWPELMRQVLKLRCHAEWTAKCRFTKKHVQFTEIAESTIAVSFPADG